MTKPDGRAGRWAGRWWDWRLFGLWVLVNTAAFVVVPLVGVFLEQRALSATRNVVQDHRVLVVVIIAVLGAAVQGVVLGRWQWWVLQRRLPNLERRRWVIATVVPAFFVWLLVIAPQAVDLLGAGRDTSTVFRNGFVQALVLGPLIGLSQAVALRRYARRWAWWFAGNVTTYLTGAGTHVVGLWLQHELAAPARSPAFFPILAFAVHGAWMLWVTATPAASPTTPPGGADHSAVS